MPGFLTKALSESQAADPWEVFVRLLAALVLGWAVSWVYSRTTSGEESATSLPTTLVLLAVLIAMVTQVIGDNVARAFSLWARCRLCASAPSCAIRGIRRL